MRLRAITEVQYKRNSTNLDRAQAPGVRAQDSVNDLYKLRKKSKSPVSKDDDEETTEQ